MNDEPLLPNQLLLYRLVEESDRTSNELKELSGLSKTTIHLHMPVLVERGLVFIHGRARSSFYSIRPKGTFPQKTRNVRKPLPALPPIMLSWLGYTDIEPDKARARHVQGEWA